MNSKQETKNGLKIVGFCNTCEKDTVEFVCGQGHLHTDCRRNDGNYYRC